MENRTPLSVVPNNQTTQQTAELQNAGIAAEICKPPAKLNAREKKVWAYITEALFEYNLIHRTDGLALLVIVRTFDRWITVEEELEKYKRDHDGSIVVKSPNGYEQPHQLFYAARDLKKELLQWLPEAALTVTSFHKIKAEDLRPEQGDLFVDPVQQFRQRGQAMRMRGVPPSTAP